MSDPQEHDPKIKVVDRRRFTEEGELRPDREPSSAPPLHPQGAPPRPRAAPPPATAVPPPAHVAPPSSAESSRGPAEQAATAPLFLELVNELAQQAALLIEGAEGFPAQPAQARRVIDYLSVLEDKTRGNLSRDEEQALTDVVYQLRTLYVKRSR